MVQGGVVSGVAGSGSLEGGGSGGGGLPKAPPI